MQDSVSWDPVVQTSTLKTWHLVLAVFLFACVVYAVVGGRVNGLRASQGACESIDPIPAACRDSFFTLSSVSHGASMQLPHSLGSGRLDRGQYLL
jgi:hypothetical protein